MTTPWEEGGTVAIPTGQVHYVAKGSGEPVLLLHKLGGWAADWDRIAPFLPGDRRWIAMDLPGHGESTVDRPTTWEYPLSDLADGVKAAVDGLGIDRFSIVGNSLGGCAGVVIATDWPERVRRLVLISAATGGPSTREQILASEARAPHWFDSEDRPLPIAPEEFMQRIALEDPSLIPEHNASRAAAGGFVRWAERGVGLADIAGRLPAIQAPTLIVIGDRDQLRAGYAEPALAAIANSRAATITGATRFPHQEQPKAVAQEIVAFLAE